MMNKKKIKSESCKNFEQLFVGKGFCLNISHEIIVFTNMTGFDFLWDQSHH